MKQFHARMSETTSRLRWTMYIAALTSACLALLPKGLYANPMPPPPAAPGLEVPMGNRPFLLGHAMGTQNYICLPSGPEFVWFFIGPQATLFGDDGKQITTHFLSPNPNENGMPRATWQLSRDTSRVWGAPIQSSSDPAFVAPGAIPWLLLQVVGVAPGPTGGHRLTETTYIQRVDTSGGIAPTTGCAQTEDIGKIALVSYTADYYFYKAITYPAVGSQTSPLAHSQ
jgi:hypothetical protein